MDNFANNVLRTPDELGRGGAGLTFKFQRLIAVVLCASLSINLLLYIYVARFTRLMADDFCLFAEVRRIGALASIKDWLSTWDGRFASDAFMAALVWFGPRSANILPILVIPTFLVLFARILRSLFPMRPVAWTLALVLLYAIIEGAPNRIQSIYWLTGSSTYAVPLLLVVACTAIIVTSRNASLEATRSWNRALACGGLAFLAGGFSETGVALEASAWIAVGIVLRLFSSRSRCMKFIISAAVGALVAAAIVASMPGNHGRMTTTQGPSSLPRALSSSALFAFYVVSILVLDHPATLALCLLVPAFIATTHCAQATDRQPRSGVHKRKLLFLVVVTAAVFAVLMGANMPAALLASTRPPDRALLGSFVLVVLYTMAAGYAFGLAMAATPAQPWWRTIVTILVCGAVAGGPVVEAARTLRSLPCLQEFSREWDQMDRTLRSAGMSQTDGTAVWPSLSPRPFSGLDIPDRTAAKNVCIAEFFGLRAVSFSTRGHPLEDSCRYVPLGK